MSITLDGTAGITTPSETLTGGTANGVLYLNGSKVATSGSALIFDGTNFGVGTFGYGKITCSQGTIALVTDNASQRRLSFWSTSNGNSENAYIQVQNDGGTTNTGEILFATKNSGGTLAERARIFATGGVSIGDTTDPSVGNLRLGTGNLVIGTSGKGIDFSAAGGDVLTTYDEGTWSPTISSTSGTITTASSSSAFYTRVGSMVSFTVVLTITDNGSGAGQLRFTLPFSGTRGYANAIGVNASSGVTVQGTSSSASPSSIDMNKVDGTYPVTSGQSLRISGTYIV